MLLQCVLLENRPNLQVVNVHIKYTTDFLAPVRCLLHDDHIELSQLQNDRTIRAVIELPASLHIKISSISAFLHTTLRGWISFRVCTDQSSGTFDAEFLPCGPDGGYAKADLQSSVAAAVRPEKPTVQKGERVFMACQKCRKPLTDFLKFERVLELPSENWEESELFCHMHDDSRPDNGNTEQRPHDLLYGQYYFVVKRQLVMGAVTLRGRFVDCSCGAELGEHNHRSDTLKFWNEMILFTYVSKDAMW